MCRFLKNFLMLFWAVVPISAGATERLLIAAAADLKYALDEIVVAFGQENPGSPRVEVAYGSSGKFYTQIRQGAPFDLYFSADIDYPRQLAAAGMVASAVTPFARGRLVLWSATRDVQAMTLADLSDPSVRRIAIANPRHAPYGKRAEEALRAAGVYDTVAPRLVFGENVAQTAQYAQTGNADVGLIALSLALSPELATRGTHVLVPESLHQPLRQGVVVTRQARDPRFARRFAAFVLGPAAQRILTRYGFASPGEGP